MNSLQFEGFGGVKLACRAYGSPSDPAVLLLPPSGQSGAFWRDSAEALADAGRYALCLDLRGLGDSGHAPDGRYDLDAHAADLRAVLAALPGRAFAVGAGLGALVSLVAIGEGETTIATGLALIDVSLTFDQAQVERMQAALVSRTQGANDPASIKAALSAAHPGERPGAIGPAILSAFETGKEGTLRWKGDPRALAADDFLGQRERLRQAAARIGVPTTVLVGNQNATISLDAARDLQSLIPHAELAEIEGEGHLMAAAGADAFNAVLLEFLERRLPRQPLSYVGGSEPRVLRDALGCFATGVTIVTTVDAQNQPIGLTANSFTSVSLDPPLVLFSLAKGSANLPAFEQAGRFAINVLHIGQQPQSYRFVQRDIDRFEGVDWSFRADGGAPVLAGTLASFDCTTHAIHDGGDHLIFIGKVERAWFEPHRDPLLYFRGKYRRLHFS